MTFAFANVYGAFLASRGHNRRQCHATTRKLSSMQETTPTRSTMNNPPRSTMAAPIPTPAFLRPDAAARLCGVSRRFLADLSARGALQAYRPSARVVLYRPDELKAALTRGPSTPSRKEPQ